MNVAVTLVMMDIVKSLKLQLIVRGSAGDRADIEYTERYYRRLRARVAALLQSLSGKIHDDVGDQIAGYFDHAADAIRFAVKLQQEMKSSPIEVPSELGCNYLQLRIAVGEGTMPKESYDQPGAFRVGYYSSLARVLGVTLPEQILTTAESFKSAGNVPVRTHAWRNVTLPKERKKRDLVEILWDERAPRRPTAQKLITRRDLVGVAIGALGSSLFYAGYSKWRGPFLVKQWQDESPAISPPVELERILPEWGHFNFVPGTAHPVEGYHPDIEEGCRSLAALIANSNATFHNKEVRILLEHQLPKVDLKSNLCLIGGPIASTLSRQWRQFEIAADNIIRRPHGNPHNLRWDFYYERPSADAVLPTRYVRGKQVKSWPKYILDHHSAGPAKMQSAMISPETGLLERDRLLVTYCPNLFAREYGTILLDIADLHGQGERSFHSILDNADLRAELEAEIRKEKARFFQALYEVPVNHDHTDCLTLPQRPRLVGIHKLA